LAPGREAISSERPLRDYIILSLGDIGEPVFQTQGNPHKTDRIRTGGFNPAVASNGESIDVDNQAVSTAMEVKKLRDVKAL